MTTATAPKPASTDRKIAQKWGAALAGAGWTAMPNVIIKRQKALGLTPLDVNIILQLLTYWWGAREPAAPVEGDHRCGDRR